MSMRVWSSSRHHRCHSWCGWCHHARGRDTHGCDAVPLQVPVSSPEPHSAVSHSALLHQLGSGERLPSLQARSASWQGNVCRLLQAESERLHDVLGTHCTQHFISSVKSTLPGTLLLRFRCDLLPGPQKPCKSKQLLLAGASEGRPNQAHCARPRGAKEIMNRGAFTEDKAIGS